ncbi:50S ribosomal protein L11 methyltransferase [Maribellus sediminis]|uniref:50S ribosomal protein L11 methyltransferase n=1 Tax=Maribellus sediminis TaxID=2696285 RepID=UPI00142FCDD4|nr:50S ribosomal protein L11 methyltransferase [Maribellus sediminis]
MEYKKLTIVISPFQEWLRDIITSQLANIGFDSFVDHNNGVDAYIPANLYHKGELNAVLDEFSEDFAFDVKSELIADRNWNEEWEKNYFKPLVVADECVVRAPFHKEFPHLKYEIVIEPNMAFGTGNHETTSLMLEYILKSDVAGKKVLDMGCGTGILGILCSMKEAKAVTAIDIDQWSFDGALGNTKLNKIFNIDVKLGDAALLGEENYDLILANIQRNVLLNDMPSYNKVLNDGGTLIMSGFYSEDIPAIKEKAESLGLKDAGHQIKNNWVAYAFVKA